MEKEAATAEAVKAAGATAAAMEAAMEVEEMEEGMACEQKSVHTSVRLGSCVHRTIHERDGKEVW